MDEKMLATLDTIYDSLTEEQRERVTACKTLGELSAFLSDEVVQLSDEAIEGIAGGYLYFDAPTTMWQVIDDRTGFTLGQEPEKFEAIDTAKRLGVSDVEISWEQLWMLRRGQPI